MVVCEPLFCFAQSQRLQQRTLDPVYEPHNVILPLFRRVKIGCASVVVGEGPAQRH